ncbi:hypothetical protein BDF19DRAFT_437956 [Syncephalis fuscata]|nr:hypothetical protein BDF19DRAFT_437956 [Syncephalis fuscata]
MHHINIAFYVSSHGFGHATRAAHLVLQLLSLDHQQVAKVTVCTKAPEFLFSDLSVFPENRYAYREREVDAGVVQLNGYTIDALATLAAVEAFQGANDTKAAAWIDAETIWLREEKVNLILLDAPYLPCEAAHQADIPSFIISNFTFDTIYSHIYFTFEEMKSDGNNPQGRLCEQLIKMTTAYAKTKLILHLPGSLPILAFESATNGQAMRVLPTPCSPKPIQSTREVTRSKLGLPLAAPLLLVAFGGHQQTLDAWCRIELPPNWHVAGYGTCSECILARTPMIYVSRPNFIEELKCGVIATALERGAFENGQWMPVIQKAVNLQASIRRHTDDANKLQTSHVTRPVPGIESRKTDAPSIAAQIDSGDYKHGMLPPNNMALAELVVLKANGYLSKIGDKR